MIYFIVGMSCSGKDYVCKDLPLHRIPSTTTREPRLGDKGYTYVKREDISVDDFAELEEHCGNLYGTRKEDLLLGEKSAFKIIEPKGLAKLRNLLDHKVIYVHTTASECKRRMKERDSTIDQKRFSNSVVAEFMNVLKDADLLISGNDKGREELLSYIKETEGWLKLPKTFNLNVGQYYFVTRRYSGNKVTCNKEKLTKIEKRVDGKIRLVFDQALPGTLYPISKTKKYGITRIRRER